MTANTKLRDLIRPDSACRRVSCHVRQTAYILSLLIISFVLMMWRARGGSLHETDNVKVVATQQSPCGDRRHDVLRYSVLCRESCIGSCLSYIAIISVISK